MFDFLSARSGSKDQAAARTGICLFALLFFVLAALSSLPSPDRLTALLSEKGLAGYVEASQDERLHEKALQQFTDRPASEQTTAPLTEPIPTAEESAYVIEYAI